MSDVARKSWWRSGLPDVSVAVSRFPLAVTIAVLFTAYKLTHDNIGEVEGRVLGALADSFLWVVAVDFYVENQKRSFPARVGLWVVAILLIAVLIRFGWDIWFSPPLLLGGLFLLVGVVGLFCRWDCIEIFWLFF